MLEQPSGGTRILTERIRQIEEKGFDKEHDVGRYMELLAAADCYIGAAWELLVPETEGIFGDPPEFWPWDKDAWHPEATAKENMVKAGALVAAAINSMQATELQSD